MNTQIHEATGSTPYEHVFGQRPRTVVFPSKADEKVLLEEELEEEGVCFEENPERVPGKLSNEMERKQSEGVLSEVQTKYMKENRWKLRNWEARPTVQ